MPTQREILTIRNAAGEIIYRTPHIEDSLPARYITAIEKCRNSALTTEDRKYWQDVLDEAHSVFGALKDTQNARG